MFWADRVNRLAGVVLLVFAALLVVSIALGSTTTANPLARGETEEMLRDMNDDETLTGVLSAVNVASDTVVLVVLAGALYVAFRDRSPALAVLGALSFAAASVAFALTDATGVALQYLAADFTSEGGAAGVAAGDPAILQSARVLALPAFLGVLVALTFVGVGLLSFGLLIATAPEGELNPPRWMGFLAAASGLVAFFGWIVVADWETGMAVVAVAMVGIVAFAVVLGGWLLARAETPEARRSARAARTA